MNFSSPGLYWPFLPPNIGGSGLSVGTAATLNAASLRLAFIGTLFIYGRPTAAKTLSAAGSGKIEFRAGTTTWANAGTNVDLGIQGVSTSAGPAAQPDGTFTVKKSIVPGTTAISSASWNSITMGTGSASLTHGQLIAVVFDMTARAGADSLIVQAIGSAAGGSFPVTNTFNVSWGATGGAFLPDIVIVFDDGTLATIDGGIVISTTTNESFKASTNPNERGILFQVPVDCYVDAVWAYLSVTDGSSGMTFGLYTNPVGGQSSLTTLAIDSHQLGGTSGRLVIETLPTQQLLRANSEYGVTLLATGTSNMALVSATLSGSAGHFELWPGGATQGGSVGGRTLLSKITRNGSSGNFAVAAANVSYLIGVRIASFLYANTLVNGTGLVA